MNKTLKFTSKEVKYTSRKGHKQSNKLEYFVYSYYTPLTIGTTRSVLLLYSRLRFPPRGFTSHMVTMALQTMMKLSKLYPSASPNLTICGETWSSS